MTGTARRVIRKLRLGAVFGVLDRPDRLAGLYGDTDKLEHGYFPHYRCHLGARRFRRQTVYEIGVGGNQEKVASGSLFVWRDYLVRSTIVGIDLYPKEFALGSRVHFVRADQNEPDELAVAVARHGRPDVVIDDGSHVGEHIVTSFTYLWPLLPPGGLYVVEDLSTSYYPAYGGDREPGAVTGVGLLAALAGDVQTADPTFQQFPEWGEPPARGFADVAAVHVYPGVAFIEKAR